MASSMNFVSAILFLLCAATVQAYLHSCTIRNPNANGLACSTEEIEACYERAKIRRTRLKNGVDDACYAWRTSTSQSRARELSECQTEASGGAPNTVIEISGVTTTSGSRLANETCQQAVSRLYFLATDKNNEQCQKDECNVIYDYWYHSENCKCATLYSLDVKAEGTCPSTGQRFCQHACYIEKEYYFGTCERFLQGKDKISRVFSPYCKGACQSSRPGGWRGCFCP